MELTRPLKLSPDLFTPRSRTPWGGYDIARRFKQDWVKDPQKTMIGESWEVSCDPAFPSVVVGADVSLKDLIDQQPNRMLSPGYVQKYGAHCDILVKLINAADPLSLQVHPTDDDEALKPGECGKPESWLVLHAEPGAGLYLGFSQPVPKEELEALLKKDGDLKPYLQFVPVKEGDYFEIEPGVVHAIGPGVTLLEPQRVRAGKAGKTYRFWDWSRRYNPDGSLNMESGAPRELHINEGLKIIDPTRQVGAAYVAKLRRKPVEQNIGPGIAVASYPANANYQVHRITLQKGSRLTVKADLGFLTFLGLGGEISMGEKGGVTVARGEPGFVPYDALPLDIVAKDDSDLALIVPAITKLAFE